MYLFHVQFQPQRVFAYFSTNVTWKGCVLMHSFFMKYKRLRAFAYFFTNMTQVGRAIRYFDTNKINKNTLWHIFIHKAQTKSNSKMKFIYPRTHREDSYQVQRSQSWTSWKPSWGSACQFCCWWCGYTFLKSRIRRNVKEKGILKGLFYIYKVAFCLYVCMF